ncbi:hypothetical protein QMG61_15205 [Cryobacterium sp. PH31-AA6]|uniref:hypothetical protein n=1 Tax=Cryobacterium sp. PH31-AA6 TaxID=3046205 RepID=UPI0024BAD4F0|nr:hypothetical protein [Cryobacterium sp. PH31-AA6]MDJ0325112.1 hypothetical protein [Cryobacterium sp. PH31-AA6]
MSNRTATMTRATVTASKYPTVIEDEGTVDERSIITVFQGERHYTRIEVTSSPWSPEWSVYASAEEDNQTPPEMRAFAALVIVACDLADELNAASA